jgi:Fe-S-cluster containining protein
LSEAAALSDIFVFRLMFRLYWLPQRASDYRRGGERQASTDFFEKKRLLSAFSARKYPAKALLEAKPVAYTKYLVISALALDTIEGECGALNEKRCGIYDRRPLSCRSVPLHYSRAEANAESDLEAFARTSGYRCDTSDAAPIIIEDGRIVDPEIRAARSAAIALAACDRPWSEAIVRRMSGSVPSRQSLPGLEEIEANAGLGAVTVSMREAWQIAADIGFITRDECDGLIALQLRTIRKELANPRCTRNAIETLTQMEREYARHGNGILRSQ